MMRNKKSYNFILIALVIIGIILYSYPYISIGVVNNDELFARYWNMQGFKTSFDYYFYECVYAKGRVLSSWLIPVTVFLGFIGKSSMCFRLFQLLSVASNVLLFYKVLVKIFKDEKFASFISLLNVAFLTITFEPTLPNAYNTTYGIILSLLFLSFLAYIESIRNNNRSLFVISMVLFFITICGYEAFITYIPIYMLLYILIEKERSSENSKICLKKCLKIYSGVIATGIFFLTLYVITGKLFPSNYAGTQIGFSINSFLNVIGNLTKLSFPGVVLLTDKYRYLGNYYQGLLTPMGVLRVCCVVLIVGVLIMKVIKEPRSEHFQKKGRFYIICVIASCFCAIILPTLPLAISDMYQNLIGENGFLGLPVTYLGYYAAVLLIGFCAWCLLQHKKYVRIMKLIVLLGVISLTGMIQISNEIFSQQLSSNFKRLETMESLFESETINKLDGEVCYTTDMFKSMNMMAVHDSYWSDFARLKGIDLTVVNSEYDTTGVEGYSIYESGDLIFTLVNENRKECKVFVKQQISEPTSIKIGPEQYMLFANLEEKKKDGSWYVYTVEID